MSVVDSPSHIYYDVQINNFQSTTTESPRLVFSETRNTSFVPKVDDYFLSVVRFQVDTYSLPSFIADIEPYQDDRDLMIHSITLEADVGGTITTTEPFFFVGLRLMYFLKYQILQVKQRINFKTIQLNIIMVIRFNIFVI